MLGIEHVEQRIACQVNSQAEGAVAIVLQQLVAREDVIAQPRGAPPAGGDAYLRTGALDGHVEGLGLQTLPDVLRNGIALLARRIALGSEAVVAAPVDLAERAAVRPDRNLHFLHAGPVHPDVFGKVDVLYRVAATREEQMLGVEHVKQRVAGQINRKGERAVAVVGQPLIAREEVVARPSGAPPAGGDAYLRTGALNGHVERPGFHLLPHILRNGIALFACGIAGRGEAIVAAPVDLAERAAVLPYHRLHCLPVALVGTWLVSEFRHLDGLAVVCMQQADEGALEDILTRKTEHQVAGALAIEILMFQKLWLTLGIQQLNAVDELQVRAVDGDQLAARSRLTGLLGEARHVRMTHRQRKPRLCLSVGSPHDDLTAVGCYAGRGVHTDHVVTHNLEVGRLHAPRELYLSDVGKTGTIDGHRLVGDNLHREESLDAQSHVGRTAAVVLSTGREGEKE